MVIIKNLSERKFSINGIEYAKICQPIQKGSTAIAIIQIYNELVVMPTEQISNIEVDGTVYQQIEDLFSALIDVVYPDDKIISELKQENEDFKQEISQEIDAIAAGEIAKDFDTLANAIDYYNSLDEAGKNKLENVKFSVSKDNTEVTHPTNETNSNKGIWKWQSVGEVTIGKNKFNKDADVDLNARIEVDGRVTSDPSYTSKVFDYMPIDGNTTYITNSAGNVVIAEYAIEGDESSWIKNNVVYGTTTFTTDANTKFYRAQRTLSADVSTLQIEEGNISTAYEAYTISGGSPDNIVFVSKPAATLDDIPEPQDLSPYALKTEIPDIGSKPGKNKFPDTVTFETGKKIDSSGNVVNDATRKLSSSFNLKGGQQYVKNNLAGYNFHFFDESGNYISSVNVVNTPFTTPASTSEVRFDAYYTNDLSQFQIEEGDTSTTYEPYELISDFEVSQESVTAALGINQELAIPSKIYAIRNRENNYYFKAILRRWVPDIFFLRFTGSTSLIKNNQSRFFITPTASSYSLTAKLYDNEFREVLTKSTQLLTSLLSTDNGLVKYLSIGDSYTAYGSYQNQVKSIAPNIELLGILQGHQQFGASNFNEGRSGWTIADYFNKIDADNGSSYFSPFMQPSGSYIYKGSTTSWAKAVAATGPGTGGTLSPLYAKAIEIGFNSNGYLTNPNTNDVLYSNSNSRYEYWNGSAWTEISEATLNFSFNFSKYRTAFGIDLPNVVSIMLGVNDFSTLHPNMVSDALTDYVNKLDEMIASIKSDNSSIDIAVMIPTSSFASVDNTGDKFIKMMNASMWIARKRIIEEYDGRENENIYLVDAGASIDDVYGFEVRENNPFPEYSGVSYDDRKRSLASDAVHPAEGYKQIGSTVAAFIQSVR